jgi:hypothetical protein
MKACRRPARSMLCGLATVNFLGFADIEIFNKTIVWVHQGLHQGRSPARSRAEVLRAACCAALPL